MKDLRLKIDKDKCIHCGLCVNDCIANVLKFDDNKIPQAVNPDRCIECQHCLSICPVGALSILGKLPENSVSVQNHNPDDILNLIKTRRSYRHFKQENIPSDIMEKLKNMLNRTPTGVNDHRLHFSIIDDIDVMNDFRDYTNKKLIDILSKPIFNNVAKKFGHYKNALLKGKDVIFRGAPHMVVVSSPVDAPCKDIDPVIALSYFELYAQSLGIGTCWCGLAYGVLRFMPELCKQLEIPDNYKLSYVMLFGMPDVNYKRAVQPEPFKIISVKKGNRNLSRLDKLKRFFVNSFK